MQELCREIVDDKLGFFELTADVQGDRDTEHEKGTEERYDIFLWLLPSVADKFYSNIFNP